MLMHLRVLAINVQNTAGDPRRIDLLNSGIRRIRLVITVRRRVRLILRQADR
jgi:hypothetical protein